MLQSHHFSLNYSSSAEMLCGLFSWLLASCTIAPIAQCTNVLFRSSIIYAKLLKGLQRSSLTVIIIANSRFLQRSSQITRTNLFTGAKQKINRQRGQDPENQADSWAVAVEGGSGGS